MATNDNNASPDSLENDVRRWDTVTSQINADRPIDTLDEDLLERGTFCSSLAKAIRGWKGEESLVIGLYGPWGSGKSSVKNIVVSLLQQSEPKVPVVEFNPWSWSGEDRLVSAFFEELGAALPALDYGGDHEALSKKWKAYAARMTLGGTSLGHLKTASEVAGIPWVPMILGTLSAAADSGSKLAEQAAKAHEVTDDTPAQKLKEQLSVELKKLKSPVLVVMDDIDRLTTEEIRLLFRIVKANADFPNLVFVMLYDRAIVEQSLEGHVGSSGRDYMAKIVQAGFDVARPDQECLDSVLFRGLNTIIDSDSTRMKFNSDRWQQVYRDGLRPFFATLRDVRRFLSSFAFHVGLFFKENQLEVNIIDLIGIEALRVFEPDVHRNLAENSAIVFGEQRIGSGSKTEERESQSKLIEVWLDGADDKNRKAVEVVSRCLFPQIEWRLNSYGRGRSYGHGRGFEAKWLRDLRVCHSQLFDRYFSLLIPENDVSQAFISQLLAASNNRVSFGELLVRLSSPDKISAALNRFEVYADKVEFANAKEIVHALFDVGETLPHEKGQPFSGSADIYACRIVAEILRKEEDVSVRSDVAIQCLEETSALWFPCRFVALEEPTEDARKNLYRDVFDEAGIKQAIDIVANKIRNAAITNAIVGERLSFYLWRWKDWAGEEEPREWTNNYIQPSENALAFLASMTHVVHVSSGRSSSSYMELDMKNINTFVDAKLLEEKLSPYFAETIAAEHQTQFHKHAEVLKAAKKAFANQPQAKDTEHQEEPEGQGD